MADLTIQTKGEIQVILSPETFSVKARTKQGVIISVSDGKSNQFLPIYFYDDDINFIRGVSVGDIVDILFKAGGFESKGKYFPAYTGIRIEKLR